MTDYSCALVGDIFLQGNLYVTYNYFAFHSNVFGYVRKVSVIALDRNTFLTNLTFVKSIIDTYSHG